MPRSHAAYQILRLKIDWFPLVCKRMMYPLEHFNIKCYLNLQYWQNCSVNFIISSRSNRIQIVTSPSELLSPSYSLTDFRIFSSIIWQFFAFSSTQNSLLEWFMTKHLVTSVFQPQKETILQLDFNSNPSAIITSIPMFVRISRGVFNFQSIFSICAERYSQVNGTLLT